MTDLNSDPALRRHANGMPNHATSQPDGLQVSPLDFRALQQAFQAATVQAGTKQQLFAGLFDSVMCLPDVMGVARYASTPEGALSVSEKRLPSPITHRDSMLAWLQECGARAIRDREVVADSSSEVRDLLAVAQAVPWSDGTADAVVVLFRSRGKLSHVAAVLVQLLVTHVVVWELRRDHGQASAELRATAAVLELVERAITTETLADAASLVANELREYLGCQYVAIGLRAGEAGCRLETISGLAEFDRNSPMARKFEAALDETAVCDEVTSWPPLEGPGSRQLLAHRQLVETIAAEAVVSVPLRTVDGLVVGVLACVGRSSIVSDTRTARLVASAGQPVGGALHVARRVAGSRLRRAIKAFFSNRWTTGRRLILAASIVLGLLLLTPIRYRIQGKCTTEPVSRRFSVAPHDGLLENTFAEPGDFVHKGQLLARMDGREIRWELAGIAADYHQADKERDVHLARHNVPETLSAQLKMESLETRSKLLKYREKQLDIRAPIDGIVLSGSIDHRENYPVTVGNVLYEIAPLSEVRMEIAVAAEEIGHVRNGMPVKIFIEGQGVTPMRGEVGRIRPRSEIRGEENIFVAEVVVPNDDGVLRPGMTGIARVIGKRHALGWNLFHRAWERTVAYLRW